jgi:Fe-S-cluster containining protein
VALYLFKKVYKYSIKELKYNNSYECIFYDRISNGCGIYDARPNQCKTFPFWDYYKTRITELKQECPGIIDG